MEGSELKAWRTANNRTQDYLARVLGVAQDTVRRWESGRTAIPAQRVTDIRAVMGNPPDEAETPDLTALSDSALLNELAHRAALREKNRS